MNETKNQVNQMADQDIIDDILAGNKSLYELIIRRYNPYLYKVGRSYSHSHEDTQDLMQDTFIDAYKGLKNFENRSNFKTWLIRIMLNNCYRKTQKSSYKNEFSGEINENVIPMFSESNQDPYKMVHNKELGHIMEEALARIPQKYRMVFSLREMNGMSVSETADLLKISEANVKVRLNRAKTMMKDELERSYTATDLFEFNLIYCNAIVENVMNKINQL